MVSRRYCMGGAEGVGSCGIGMVVVVLESL